jgi:predicted Zn-dependent protease with MMP-like domain
MGKNTLKHWARLEAEAEAQVCAALAALPPDMRAQAEAVPVVCERAPSRAVVEDGIEPDVLGLFVGGTFQERLAGETDVPAQVLLFLENIWDEAGADWREYRRQVRKTLFHEWGHYLGWDEDDLAARGLE